VWIFSSLWNVCWLCFVVWRNEKAEKLQAQEYDIKRRQEMEEVQETIRKNHEQNRQSSKLVNVNMKESEIRKISSPETLYNLYQNSKDPEGLQVQFIHLFDVKRRRFVSL
jgi:hypothetical protein